MSNFKRVQIVDPPRARPEITEDNIYWKRLEFPVAVKEFGPVDFVDFSVVDPFYFAVTSSVKVQIYSSRNNEVSRTISRFKKAAYGGNFRADGKLLIAGSEEGSVAVFDGKSKSMLRLFKGHKAATHRCKFRPSGTSIASFSDDKSVVIWDIPSESRLLTFEDHNDYIRAGTVFPENENLILSGSYDHTIKLYDTRTSNCVLSLDHGAPVESVLVFPSGGVFLSSGGTEVKVWDAVGGKVLAQMSQHHKTITCLHFASENRRIMSGSLDRHVKIYDTTTYRVIHTLDYPSPILSLAVAPEDKVVVVGMADGLVSIRHKREDKQKVAHQNKRSQKIRHQYRMYGEEFRDNEVDLVVQNETQARFATYDKHLRSFQSTRCLDSVLTEYMRTKKPQVTVSVMQELIRRGAMRAALAGRDAEALTRLIKFIIRYLRDPRFSRVLLDVSLMLIDLYGPKLGDDPGYSQQFEELKKCVETEVTYLKKMMELGGAIQSILNVATNSGITEPQNFPSLDPMPT